MILKNMCNGFTFGYPFGHLVYHGKQPTLHQCKKFNGRPIQYLLCQHRFPWEIGIKYSLGKLQLGTDLKKIFGLIDQTGFTILPIKTAHILMNTTLEFHHRDPFDRLIIAQAMNDGLVLVSKDQAFKDYDIELF